MAFTEHVKRKVNRRALLGALVIVLGLLMIIGGIGYKAYQDVFGSFGSKTEESSGFIGEAYSLKADIKLTLACIKEQNIVGAETALANADFESAAIREQLDSGFWKAAGKIPLVSDKLDSVYTLLDAVDEASEEILHPMLALMTDYPLSAIKEDNDINATALSSYLDFAEEHMPQVRELAAELETVDLGTLDADGKIASYSKMLNEVIAVYDNYSEYLPLAREAVELLDKYPLSAMKTEDGFNVSTINYYLDFLENHMPEIREVAAKLGTVDLGELDAEDKIASVSIKLSDLIAQYDEVSEYFPVLRALLGNGEDRLYVFAAQNSAEIRSSGGFPGSVGTIQIRDGILTVGSFESVYDAFAGHMSNIPDTSIWPTLLEDTLFQERMWMSHDACFNPDFVRDGQIWAESYEAKNGVHVDGVVSMTPTIIQDLLQYLDPITLFDGTVLDGTNAAAVLQNGIYYNYMYGSRFNAASAGTTDALFAEAAKLVMADLVSGFSIEHIRDYMNVVTNGFSERRIMLWLADDDEEQMVKDLNWDGGLNDDPNNPEIGVYYSLTVSSKLGWFLNMDYSLSEPILNEDGSRTYDVTVILSSIMTQADADNYAQYVKGQYYGNIVGDIYVFAPAGGEILNVTTNSTIGVRRNTYEGLEVAYLLDTWVGIGYDRTLTVTVKTAPGVNVEPVFSATPTLQKYR